MIINQNLDQPQTTGNYLVLLPDDGTTSGMSAITNSTGIRSDDMSLMENLGVVVVSSLDPDRLNSLNAAVSGDAPVLAVEPEQIMYAVNSPAYITDETANFLKGFEVGITSLVGTLTEKQTSSARESGPSAFANGRSTWGLQATKVISSQYSGQGIKVAVLDTGMDLSHPDYLGRAITSESFIAGEAVQDHNGHGTHCIGTSCGPLTPPDPSSPMRYGIAYNAEIFAGKVLSNSGSGPDNGILEGINWAINNNCHIISMSLASATFPGMPHSPIYEAVAQRALQQGTIIIAAASNDSNRPGVIRPVGRPANSPSILSVAALTSNLGVSWFSNGSINLDGGQVDISAPGGNSDLPPEPEIYSTWSTTAQPYPGNPLNAPARYKSISGTSMATPHVAGIAALYAEMTGKRGIELWAMLMRDAQRLPISSADVGIGLVQAPS